MRPLLLAALVVLAASGCGSSPTARQCMNSGTAGDIVNSATLMRVEVFAGGVPCDGTHALAAADSALMSRTFAAGEKIALDIPPGRHTVVITAFGDASATQELGGACADDTFLPGQAVCLDLTLAPAPDMASMAGTCRDVDCPFNQHCDLVLDRCVPGCKSSTECAQLATGDGGVAANTTCCKGQCVDPLNDKMHCGACGHGCSTANVASVACMAGVCQPACLGGFANCGAPAAPAADDGCETNLAASGQKLCNGSCVPLASCCAATDCTAAPAPAACQVGICESSGSCSYTAKANSQICGSTCCVGVNGSCAAGTCALSCTGGFGDCNNDKSDGCELRTNIPAHCSACGTACDTGTVNGAPTCNGSTCQYAGGCKAGRIDCNSAAPNANGCECAGTACCGTACQVAHLNQNVMANGLGQTYFHCSAVGTPGTGTTASSGYDVTMATAARAAYPIAGTDSGITSCGSGNMNCMSRSVSSGTKHCVVWCFADNPSGTAGMNVNIGGHVYYNTASGGACFCPYETDPSWN
jgi:hypothetical protein